MITYKINNVVVKDNYYNPEWFYITFTYTAIIGEWETDEKAGYILFDGYRFTSDCFIRKEQIERVRDEVMKNLKKEYNPIFKLICKLDKDNRFKYLHL